MRYNVPADATEDHVLEVSAIFENNPQISKVVIVSSYIDDFVDKWWKAYGTEIRTVLYVVGWQPKPFRNELIRCIGLFRKPLELIFVKPKSLDEHVNKMEYFARMALRERMADLTADPFPVPAFRRLREIIIYNS